VYRLDTTPDFDRDFKALDREIATRLLKKLEWLRQHPEILRFQLKNPPKDLKGITEI